MHWHVHCMLAVSKQMNKLCVLACVLSMAGMCALMCVLICVLVCMLTCVMLLSRFHADNRFCAAFFRAEQIINNECEFSLCSDSIVFDSTVSIIQWSKLLYYLWVAWPSEKKEIGSDTWFHCVMISECLISLCSCCMSCFTWPDWCRFGCLRDYLPGFGHLPARNFGR